MQPSFTAGDGGKFGFESTVDLVVDARDGREKRRLQFLAILQQLHRVTAIVAYLQADKQRHRKENLLECVRVWQVRYDAGAFSQHRVQGRLASVDHHLLMRDLHSLRMAGRSRSVANHVDVSLLWSHELANPVFVTNIREAQDIGLTCYRELTKFRNIVAKHHDILDSLKFLLLSHLKHLLSFGRAAEDC